MFGFWPGKIIRTPDESSENVIIIVRCTDFLCRECSDLWVGGRLSRYPNIVRICKSVRIIG